MLEAEDKFHYLQKLTFEKIKEKREQNEMISLKPLAGTESINADATECGVHRIGMSVNDT